MASKISTIVNDTVRTMKITQDPEGKINMIDRQTAKTYNVPISAGIQIPGFRPPLTHDTDDMERRSKRGLEMVGNPKGAVSKMGNPDQSKESVLWKNRIAVNDFVVPVNQTTPTKVIDSASLSDRLETWATPFSSPQKQLDTQPKKEAIDASAHLAKLIQQHSKTKDPQMATTSKEPTTPKLVEMMHTFEPSSSAPRRAPTAQMVPLPPNTAVTTAPAGPVTTETSKSSLFGPRPSSMTLSNSKAFFPATASPSLLVAPIIPSSSTAALKKSAIEKCSPKKPKTTMTPAPAIAPSASHVQNTKLLSRAKNHTNGVKKRQRIRTSSSPKSASALESVPEEKRGRGRPP
ncbi:MAG: hypothetical protein ASARMPRED_005704 [Alectoria sarmentosa]|nr:MAG: hypothetical protein ASARMPRED_005704 [Alectoria sarmentosa]